MNAGLAFDVAHEGESWRIVETSNQAGRFVVDVTFQPGAGPPRHSHVENERLEVLQGELSVWLPTGVRVLAPGEMLEVPVGTVHRIWSSSRAPTTVRATYDGRAFESLVSELPPGDRAGMVRMARHLRFTGWKGSRVAHPFLRVFLSALAWFGGLLGVRARIEGARAPR
jgi:quercetin dioxygenase-like cupin family protein